VVVPLLETKQRQPVAKELVTRDRGPLTLAKFGVVFKIGTDKTRSSPESTKSQMVYTID